MTERSTEQDAPRAADNDSRDSTGARAAFSAFASAIWRIAGQAGPLGLAVLLLGIVAAVFLVAAEFATYREIQVVTASCEELTRSSPDVAEDCLTTGGEQHDLALVVVAIGVLLMSFGAGPGRSIPAALALGMLGVVVLLIALLGDIPNTDVTGAVGRDFDQAEGKAGATIMLELIGAALALTAAALRLVAERRAARG